MCLFSLCRQAEISSEASASGKRPHRLSYHMIFFFHFKEAAMWLILSPYLGRNDSGWLFLVGFFSSSCASSPRNDKRGPSHHNWEVHAVWQRGLIQGLLLAPALFIHGGEFAIHEKAQYFHGWLRLRASVCTSSMDVKKKKEKELIQNQVNSSKCQHNYCNWH